MRTFPMFGAKLVQYWLEDSGYGYRETKLTKEQCVAALKDNWKLRTADGYGTELKDVDGIIEYYRGS